MNKKIWDKPEVKILDVKRDTKIVGCYCPTQSSGKYKPPHHHPHKPPHHPWCPWWPW